MVKQLIYDSCMIVKKETIISIYHDIQVVHKKQIHSKSVKNGMFSGKHKPFLPKHVTFL